MKEIFTSETFQTLSDRIDMFMEEHDVYGYDNVTIVIEKVTEELKEGKDEPDYHWKATLMPKPTDSAIKDLLVEEHGYVDFFVSSEEIRLIAIEEQRELSDEQMEEVMEILSSNDLEIGICEEAVRGAISEVCADATDQGWDETDDHVDLQKSAWGIVESNFTSEQ